MITVMENLIHHCKEVPFLQIVGSSYNDEQTRHHVIIPQELLDKIEISSKDGEVNICFTKDIENYLLEHYSDEESIDYINKSLNELSNNIKGFMINNQMLANIRYRISQIFT